MRSHPFSQASAVLVLVCRLGVSATGQLARPTITTLPNGVVQVVNTGPSRWVGTSGWRLELERTIAPDEGSPGMLMQPYQIAVDRAGRLVVGDRKAGGLLVFEPDGRFARTIGRDGEGPGEFRAPIDIDVRGDTIGAYAPNIARSLAWRTNGTLLGQWVSAPCCGGGATLLDGRGHLFPPTNIRSGAVDQNAMVRWRFDGTVVDTLWLPPPDPPRKRWRTASGGGAIGIPFVPFRYGTFDSRQWYIHGYSSVYTLVVAPHGHDTSRVIVLPGERARTSEKLRDSLYNRYKAIPSIQSVVEKEDIAAEQPYFTALHVDEQDNIWIERPGSDGMTASFDVVDSEGRFLGSVAAPTGSNRGATWRNGRLYRFGENADGAPVIQVFRVNRGK